MRMNGKILLIVLSPLVCLAGDKDTERVPFSNFDELVRNHDGDQKKLSKVFAEERKRLGDRFQPELMTWMGTNLERHNYASLYLDEPESLHGLKPMSELALLIGLEGVELAKKSKGQESLVSQAVVSAIQAKRLGLMELAKANKRIAEDLYAKNPDVVSAQYPIMQKQDYIDYDSIPIGGQTSQPSSNPVKAH